MLVRDVVKVYRTGQGMTMREFAESLTMVIKANLSHAAIVEWEKGRSEPRTDLMLQLAVAHRDWRRSFAVECLRAKLPEVFVDNVEELRGALFGEDGR